MCFEYFLLSCLLIIYTQTTQSVDVINELSICGCLESGIYICLYFYLYLLCCYFYEYDVSLFFLVYTDISSGCMMRYQHEIKVF